MKLSPNDLCPCGSNKKYKKCCELYHKGALAKDPLTLMKSRYSAYVSRETMYIIKTTDSKNPHFQNDKKKWKNELNEFCKTTTFTKLEIISYDDKYVTFKAYTEQGILHEKSQFIQRDGRWYYLNGEFLD